MRRPAGAADMIEEFQTRKICIPDNQAALDHLEMGQSRHVDFLWEPFQNQISFDGSAQGQVAKIREDCRRPHYTVDFENLRRQRRGKLEPFKQQCRIVRNCQIFNRCQIGQDQNSESFISRDSKV